MQIIRTIPYQNLFFETSNISAGNLSPKTEGNIINIFDEIEYQSILGFGGAFTESAAYNYAQLSDDQKKDFLQKYFSRDHGIGYNFGRLHINSCDFSIDIYSYVEKGDMDLTTFSLERDRKYIIPFLKDALSHCKQELILFASPWSPPAYMKDNESVVRGGALKEEYKNLWARYYARYIHEMEAEGICISAISIQNEPNAIQAWESCSYSAEQERDFIEQHLAPVLDQEGLSHIKLIIWDHNKERVYDRSKKIFTSEYVRNRVWAVGHHWYSGDHFEGLQLVHEMYDKVLISSETCCPIDLPDITVAERYGAELCGNFNHFSGAFCDWNLLLSQDGGPFHNRSEKTTAVIGKVLEDKSRGCYAPVLWDTEQHKLTYTPAYYYIGHFSKYVERGAVRIAITRYTEQIHACGFKNPDGQLVLILMNTSDNIMPAVIRHNDVCTSIELAPHSIVTVLLH